MISVPKAIATLLALAILLGAALAVFARIAAEYRTRGKLSRSAAVLQTGYFIVYVLSSYAFLDSGLPHIVITGALLGTSLALMVAGILLVGLSMPFVGRQSFGNEVKALRTEGLYRYSRNPQLAGGFLFIVGYAILWPSWEGAAWAALWPVISHLMARGEEQHLLSVFEEQYAAYCARTPRLIGCPRLLRPRKSGDPADRKPIGTVRNTPYIADMKPSGAGQVHPESAARRKQMWSTIISRCGPMVGGVGDVGILWIMTVDIERSIFEP